MTKILCALALAVVMAGPGRAIPAGVTAAASTKRVLPDSHIERNIRTKLAKGKLNADHFTVSVKNGIATFEGKTSVIQHKGSATRIAHTSGAPVVHNNIVNSDDAKAKAAAKLEAIRPSHTSPATTEPTPGALAPSGPPRARVILGGK